VVVNALGIIVFLNLMNAGTINLIRTEIGITPDVVHCRRLGNITAGKVQPLLVVLRAEGQADEIFAGVKNLRISSHSIVRDTVFINRHLTDAQSRAAYEMRCQRREAAKRRGRPEAGGRTCSGASGSMAS
jgi:hypothetical protein